MAFDPRPTPGRRWWLAALALATLPFPARSQTLSLLEAADSALATHPSVLAARARVDEADAGRSAARASYLPDIVGTSSLARFEKPMVVAPLHGFDPRNPPAFDRTLVQSQIGASWTLFDGGARRAGVKGADAVRDAARAGERSSVEDLLESVAGAYVAVLSTREVRAAADRQVAALRGEREHAGQRLREGTAAQVDVLRAQAALQDALAQQSTAVARVGLAERSLARLMGVDTSRVSGRPLADVSVRAGTAAADSTVDPRIVAARRTLDAARAHLRAQRATWLPSVKASGALMSFGSGAGGYTHEWQGGVQLSWPLFTGGARAASVRRAEADVRVAQEDLDQTRLAVAGALDAARTSLVEATGRAQALQASVTQWQEVARIEELSLQTGAGVQDDFLRAEAALYRAQAGYAGARYDVVMAHIRMARARGILDQAWMNTALEIAR